MIVAVELTRDIDLSLFSRFLHQSGIWHRINEAGDMQVLWVASEADKSRVVGLYAQYANAEFSLQPVETRASDEGSRWRLLAEAARSPLILTLILANVICFPVTNGVDDGQFSSWFQAMTLLEFQVSGNAIYFANLDYTLTSGQYWRLLTPMLLHFGWIHIVFNLLWVWEIGKRIEWRQGSLFLLVLVVCASLLSNLVQYWLAGPSLFGGMSGVVYGLLGFSLVWSYCLPQLDMGIPKGIYVMMLAFLVIGFTGLIDLLGLGSLANGAHLGGLVGGVGVGLVAVVLQKLRIVRF